MSSHRETDEPEAPIRVLIANLPGVLAQIVAESVLQQADMALVGPIQGQVELLMAAGDRIDVLVLGVTETGRLPGICTHLLSEYPCLRILLLRTSGDSAALYWLGLRCEHLRTVTDGSILGTIRRAYALNPVI